MKVAAVKIHNILGVEDLEINPGSVTVLEGENGSGKTSVLEALRTAFTGAHDATLLRQGASEGEIVLVLDDGTEVHKTISREASSVSVRHPQFGKISKPATYLKRLADVLSLNPIEFLTAPSKDRVNILLEAIPMHITADQLREVPAIALQGIDLDKHALEVIGKIGRAIYDLRTGVNRLVADKKATIRETTSMLPPEPPEGNWSDILQATMAEGRELQRSYATRVNATKEAATQSIQALKDEFGEKKSAVVDERSLVANKIGAERDEAIEKIRAEAEARIEKLFTDSQIEIGRCEEERDREIAEIEAERDKHLTNEEAGYKPKFTELAQKVAEAKAALEQHTKAETARTYIADLQKQAEAHEAEASKLTHALGRLEILKASLLEKLPIEGLEVRDGDIYLGGISFDRVNESRRIRLAIEIAKLRAGSLGLVAVDGLERLDPKTFAAFKKEAAKSGLQFVISHVTDGPLAISTETEGAA